MIIELLILADLTLLFAPYAHFKIQVIVLIILQGANSAKLLSSDELLCIHNIQSISVAGKLIG